MVDLICIGVDACAGLVLATWLLATPTSAWVVALGAIAGMAPDPLQFALLKNATSIDGLPSHLDAETVS